mmetsp:Transcript_16691/g.46236  ORF Transcript_16691/g.46236 Transcript_16691/m.46236 type:complete len:283 (-) Transcript_16691:322-1170(-)
MVRTEEEQATQESNTRLRDDYERRKEETGVDPCAHVAGIISRPWSPGSSPGSSHIGAFEHHALRDVWQDRVIHFGNGGQVVQGEDWSQFRNNWPNYRVVRNAPLALLELARSRIGQRRGEYHVLTNNCEHFVNECFGGVGAASGQVEQARVQGYVVGGVGTVTGCGTAFWASLQTTAVPITVLWIIPWGTTTLPMFPVWAVAAAGVGAFAAVGCATVGLQLEVQKFHTRLQTQVPIGFYNTSAEDLEVYVENIDSWCPLWSSRLDDAVHDFRSWSGVGKRKL